MSPHLEEPQSARSENVVLFLENCRHDCTSPKREENPFSTRNLCMYVCLERGDLFLIYADLLQICNEDRISVMHV